MLSNKGLAEGKREKEREGWTVMRSLPVTCLLFSPRLTGWLFLCTGLAPPQVNGFITGLGSIAIQLQSIQEVH
jgi:hypothetical protein